MTEITQKPIAQNVEKIASINPTVDLSVIIVNYNTADLLRKCLESVYKQEHGDGKFEIIVIDNASADASMAMLHKEYPDVITIENQENKGFAYANNQGLRQAKGQYLVLLNSDAEVVDNALWKMTAFLDAHPTAAAVGAHLVYPDGSFQEGAFRFPGLLQIFFDFFPLNWRLTRSRLNGRYSRKLYEGDHPRAFEVDFVLGACLMIRRTALEQIGLLDESYFMYMEEIDWCWRVRHANPAPGYSPLTVRFRPGRRKLQTWTVHCMPSATVIHHAGGTSRKFRDEMFYQLHKSRHFFYRKNYSNRFNVGAKWLTKIGMTYLGLAARWQAMRGNLDKGELQNRLSAYKRVNQLWVS
jgi:hypothetical protein